MTSGKFALDMLIAVELKCELRVTLFKGTVTLSYTVVKDMDQYLLVVIYWKCLFPENKEHDDISMLFCVLFFSFHIFIQSQSIL